MLILPAIDLINGEAVRLYQGDYAKKTVFNSNPVEVALSFKKAGAEMIHIVDLDGAKAGNIQNSAILEQIITESRLPVQIGGGIRSIETMRALRTIGIDQLILGTIALENKPLLYNALDEMADNITISLDAKNGKIFTNGWLEQTENNVLDVFKEMEDFGVKRFIYTDIVKDGTNTEPNYAMIESITSVISGFLIIAGGISQLEHLNKLKELGVSGAIVGRALYDGHINLEEAIAYVN